MEAKEQDKNQNFPGNGKPGRHGNNIILKQDYLMEKYREKPPKKYILQCFARRPMKSFRATWFREKISRSKAEKLIGKKLTAGLHRVSDSGSKWTEVEVYKKPISTKLIGTSNPG